MIIGILMAVAVPQWVNARETARKNSCYENLIKIEHAKDLWAMENRKNTGDPVTALDIAPQFLKSAVPTCPSTGAGYTMDVVGTPVSCTTHGTVP